MNRHALGQHLPSFRNPFNCGEFSATGKMTREQIDHRNEATPDFARQRELSRQFPVSPAGR